MILDPMSNPNCNLEIVKAVYLKTTRIEFHEGTVVSEELSREQDY